MLGTVARTAVVASTAQAAAGRVHRTQQQKWSAADQAQAAQAQAAQAQAQFAAAQAQQPQVAAAPAAPAMEDKLALLQQLGSLRDQGVLTDAEFEAKKSQILAS